MEELQKLYDVLVREGKYSKSFEEFKTKWSTDEAYKDKVYGVVTRDGLYSKDKDSFLQKYSVAQPAPIVKKKDSSELATQPTQEQNTMESPSEDGSLATQSINEKGIGLEIEKSPIDISGKAIISPQAKAILDKTLKNKKKVVASKKEEDKSYLENLGTNLMAGVNDVNKMITSIPETVYNVFSIPQNAIAYATGLDISANADKFKKEIGIKNPILDHYKEEGKKLEKEIADFNQKNYESSSVYDNLQKGNYQDAFELLGSGVARSAPTSIAIMAGGATLSTGELATASTAAFYDQNLEQLKEENPNASDIENNIKALGMSAAESVFSAIGEGQIGAVYKDIIKREGQEVGKQVFKEGLVQAYKGALEKYGVPVGLLGEGIEESATQITQNMISGKPAFEGAADAFILGGGSGVMFTAPISLKNAKDRIKNKIVEVDDRKKINTILSDVSPSDRELRIDELFNVPKDSPISEEQLSIASLEKSRDLLVKDLARSVKKGEITSEDAKQSLYVFDKTKQVTGQLRGVDVDEKSKVKIANLLKERESLSEKINGKDEALSVLEKQRISDINEEIKQTILKSKEDAIQEQTADESTYMNEFYKIHEDLYSVTDKASEDFRNEKITSDEYNSIVQDEESKKEKKLNELKDKIGDNQYNIVTKNADINWYEQSITRSEKNIKDIENKKNPTEEDLNYKKREEEYLERNKQELTKAKEELETLKTAQNAIQEQTTNESVLRTEQPGVELQGVGEGNAKPEVVTEEQSIIDAKPEEVVPSLKVSEALSEPSGVFVYDGKKGQLTTVGKTLVLETPDEVIDIAYDLDNISDQPLEELGVHKEEELDFKLNDDNSIELGGKKYVNNYSNPESAISQDKNGNYTVTLETENGQKRTFRGQQADRIVYETRLKNFEQNGTEQQIEDAHAAADEAIRIEDQVRESAPKREGKSVRKSKQRASAKSEKVAVKEEVTPVAETTVEEEVVPVEEAESILNLDTKDKGNLQKVFDYLDSLDKALDVNPNELNDVTRIMALGTAKAVVKTLKALVKAGITLQEAINTAAEIHSVDPKDVLKAFDVINQNEKQKSAPSPVRSEIYIGDGRLVSVVRDIKKITMTEKALLVKQIRDKIRGAKDVLKTTKEISQQLAKDIKELVSSGKITATQAANIVSKFSKVNMLNDVSVANFIDYMGKVFADAEYDNKINVAKSKLKDAKKNIVTKIGIADGLVGPLQKLFSINPNLIPESKLERYLELVNMFSARQSVLNLEEKSKVTNDVLEILDEINNERSAVDELAERFNYSENKIIEDDKLDYAATIKNMLKEEEITEEEAALMTKYKSEIIPQVKKSTLSEEELQQEKDELIDEIKKSTINSNELPTRAERDAAKKLASLLKSPAVKELSNAQLKNLLKVIDNINNGYFAHSAQLIIEEINSINNSKTLASSVNKARLLPLSKLYAKAKSILTRKDAILEMIRRNPLFNIDQVLGDFKTKDVFNSLFEKAAEAEAKFTAELKAIRLKLSNAEEKIAKSFKLDANKTLMSKFKIMTYMVQLEYESNQDSKQVNPASEFIKATIKHINEGKSRFGEKDAEMLQEILNKYADTDGNIDTKKLYDSFNSAEKEGIKTIQEVNQSLKEKAEYTASVIRGQRINSLNNYIHLNVLSDTKPNDLASGEAFADQYNNSLKPSTKAKSLIERTGKVSPLNFDVFASAEKGAKFVLMDYHLTEPIRTARKTINKTIASLDKIDKEKRRVLNAISNSFEETVKNLVDNSYMETSVGDDVANYISKQGYRSVLAGTGRFAAELLSNIGFVIISDPTTFAEGLKYTPTLMSPDAPLIMHNVNSKEINRIFPSDTLSGRLIDTNILNEVNGIKGGKAKNKAINKAQQVWDLTGKKYKNAVELTADVLITTPDKAIMRPIWFGAFASSFKNETGQDVDFEKIAANDEDYMNQNRDAIDKAKDAADERSVITGASNNAFTGILKGTSKPNQSNTIKAFNNFNNFMTRFLIYEYTSARTGIMAAMGNGSLSKKQGIALLGAVTTRMTVYSLLSKAFGSGLIGLLFGDDDEEDKKSLDKSIGQALTSTFTSMLLNRDFGNATKTIINKGIEQFNEEYLQALREGKYDPYKDAIQYSAVPIEKEGKKTGLYDYIENAAGSFGPAIKTTNLIVKTYNEKNKKKPDAIQRQEDAKNIRIPLEVLGNAGFIPLYKDIRKEVMKEMYKGLDKSNTQLRTVKAGEEFK